MTYENKAATLKYSLTENCLYVCATHTKVYGYLITTKTTVLT